MWNAVQVAKLFNLQRETIRQYSLRFSNFFSAQANPGKNRTRAYNESDMEVFALIVEMKGQGKLYSDIEAALLNGIRGTIPDEIDAIATTDVPRYNQLQLRLVFLEDELVKANDQAKEDRGQIKLLKDQLAEWQAKYEKISRENALLRAGVKITD